jgi:hypothetical protein
MALRGLGNLGLAADTDPFKQRLLEQGRIPIVVHTTMRMQSHPYENGNISNLGPVNNGVPTPPGEEGEQNPPTDDGTEEICNPNEDLFGCRPPNCKKNDSSCDPACDNGSCSVCTEDGMMANP